MNVGKKKSPFAQPYKIPGHVLGIADAGTQEMLTLADILALAQQRPIWGADYAGPAGYGDADMEQFYDRTPYQQGRTIPMNLSDLLMTDMDMQELAGADPYGNPLPPTWATPRRRR